MTHPWCRYQDRLRAAGGRALLLARDAAVRAVTGCDRVGVHQSDPPFPSALLTTDAPPHVWTPDPDGALHLPEDHVHVVNFDPTRTAGQIAHRIGDGTGAVYVDACAPGAYQLLRAVLRGAELRDATGLLGAFAPPASGAIIGPAAVGAQRRERFLAAVRARGLDGWALRTPEAACRIAEAPTTRVPAGRVAIDRIPLDELEARGDVDAVDAGAVLAAAALPRSDAELSLLRDGYARTEAAVERTLPQLRVGMTEREAQATFVATARAVGLDFDHIDHVWRVLPKRRANVPWLRGEWAGRAPWSQLTTDRVLEHGDHLAIDAGFCHQGYMTDFGWTFLVGRDPTPQEERLARLWTEVADRVTAALVPGRSAADVRAAALAGWDDAVDPVPWPLGLYVAHGVGFGGVEPPFVGTDLGVAAERAMPIEAGQVILVEPYVHVDGIGGYRAERCVEVTADGPRVLTRLPVGRWGRIV